MLEQRQRREREQGREAHQRRAAIFLSLLLHGIGAAGLGAEQIKREVRSRFQASNLTELVSTIHLATEHGEKIPQPDQFLTYADGLKNGFSEEMLQETTRQMKAEVAIAQAMVTAGDNEAAVMDYFLSGQGAYEPGQNSIVYLMSLPPEQRTGNCDARFLRLAAEVPQVYPEKYRDGLLAGQLFKGADTDGDGVLDTPGHIRFVMDLQNGTHLIVEGTQSFVEADIQDSAQQPTTIELSTLLAQSFLADQGLYTHPQGFDTISKPSKSKFTSFLDYPASSVSYGPDPNPDNYAEPVPSTGWSPVSSEAMRVTLFDEKPAEPADEFKSYPVIDSPEAARALPKDEQVHVETITSVEAATVLIDEFHGRLIIERIPSVEIAKVLTDGKFDKLTIAYLDSPQVAETILTYANMHLGIDHLDSPEVAKLIAQDTSHSITVGEMTPETAYILSHGERDFLTVTWLSPEEARQLASGRLRTLETISIDSPEEAQALKSGSIKQLILGVGETYGSPSAALESPTTDIAMARALVGGSIQTVMDRYLSSKEASAEAIAILEKNGINVMFIPPTRQEQ